MEINKRISLTILTLIILTSLSSCGQKITSKNILAKLNEKYKFTANEKKYIVSYKYTGLSPYQSYDYKHPEDKINGFGIYTIEIDKEKKEYFTHDRSQFPGNFVFEFKHFQNSKTAVSYDVNGVIDGKKLIKQNEDAYENELKRVGNVLSFEQVAILLSSHKMGDDLNIKINEDDNTAVIIHTNSQNIINTYTFNIPSLRLKALESTEDNSLVVYEDYSTEGNFEYAKKLDIYRSNKFSASISIENLKKTSGIVSSMFDIPKGYAYPKETEHKKTKITNIAKNIYLINLVNNSRFVLFKVIEKNIMVFGAPLSDEFTEETINLIKEKFPSKTIKYVFVSHTHSDHIGGLNAFAKRGITILADDYTIDGIKNYPEFNETIHMFNFKPLANKEIINGVRFYVLENEHSLKQSFAYFIDEQIIYEGDFLEVPADNSIASHLSNVEKQFIEFITNEKLKIKRIVQHHRNSNVSISTMNAYYNANIK